MYRNGARALWGIALGFVGLLLGTAQPASAVNVYDALAAWTGNAYVYVNQGETLTINSLQPGAAYTLTRPDGSSAPITGSAGPAATCTVTATVACTFSETATSEGVWRLAREGGPVRTAGVEDIAVSSAGGTVIKGRLWLETVTLNTGNQFGSAISNFYALSPVGAQYRVGLPRYEPWGMVLSADNKGIVHAGTCNSTYFSVPIPKSTLEPAGSLDGADYDVAPMQCPDYLPYRLFPEQPDPGMPASVNAWADGRSAQKWVYSDYRTPTVSGMAFTRSSSVGNAGVFAGVLGGQPGAIKIQLDIDGNGSYSDAVDVTLPAVNSAVGNFSVAWDGLNGSGAPVPTTVEVPYRVVYTGESEFHMVMTDSEGRTGGITMLRLNGPGAPDPKVNWDDSRLVKRTTDNVIPDPLKGVGVDATNPVHMWGRGIPTNLAYGWGDQRRIEDWARVDSSVANAAVGVVPALTPNLKVSKTLAAPSPLVPGSAMTYTVTATNVGTAAFTADQPGVITDNVTVGAGNVGAPSKLRASVGSATAAGSSISWSITDLPVGASATLTYDVAVVAESAVDADRTIVNRAFVGKENPAECAAPKCAEVSAKVAAATPTPTPTPTPTSSPVPSPSPTPTPPLPKTGSETDLLVFPSLFAVVIGAGLLVRSRRSR